MTTNAHTATGGIRGARPPRRMGCSEILRIEGRGKAFPLITILAVAVAYPLIAAVTCQWVGDSYLCSGEGSAVVVSGGGTLDPNAPPVVVTNVVGVCTNCSNIAPADLQNLARQLESTCVDIDEDLAALKSSISAQQQQNTALINQINQFIPGSSLPYPTTGADRTIITNWIYTTDTLQSEAARNAFESDTRSSLTYRCNSAWGAVQGVYYYANNTVKPQLSYANTRLYAMYDKADEISEATEYLSTELAQTLYSSAVECEGKLIPGGPSVPVTGSGSGFPADFPTDWCTEEQGEAMLSYLGELSDYLDQSLKQVKAISNGVQQVYQTIRNGLYSRYTAIPSSADLGQEWYSVYLQGQPTQWGYDPTNVLQRIELLLYGLSGVGTNEVFDTGTSLEDNDPDSTASPWHDVKESASSIDTDAASSAPAIETLGDKLTQLLDTLRFSSTQWQRGDYLMPAIEVGEDANTYIVPAFTLQDAGTVNDFLLVMRSALTCVFILGAVYAVFLYWRWFAGKAARFSVWAVQILEGMFNS